jgi:hypothetical protein
MERGDEDTTVMSTADAVVHLSCPECSTLIPVVITAEVYVCECGRHQGILTTPDMTDVAAHAFTHWMSETDEEA